MTKVAHELELILDKINKLVYLHSESSRNISEVFKQIIGIVDDVHKESRNNMDETAEKRIALDLAKKLNSKLYDFEISVNNFVDSKIKALKRNKPRKKVGKK